MLRSCCFVFAFATAVAPWQVAAAEEAPPAPAFPKLELSAYGFVIANTAYNTGTATILDAPTTAASGSLHKNDPLPSDGSFMLTARQTRVGLKAKIAHSEALSSEGVIEADFWGLRELGTARASVQSAPRLRLAYFTLGTKSVQLIAGQDWTFFMGGPNPAGVPAPTSLAHLVIVGFTSAGLPWNRLPQVAVRYKHDSGFHLRVAALRPVSGDEPTGAPSPIEAGTFAAGEPGALSGMPALEARIGYSSDSVWGGVGAHFGQERFQLTDVAGAATGDEVVPSYAAAADLGVKLAGFSAYVSAFMGQNLNGLFSIAGVRKDAVAGAAAGVATVESVDPVDTRGGYFLLGYDVIPKLLQVNAGAGVEQADDDDLGTSQQLIKENTAILANVIYSPLKHFDMGLEYYRNVTIYNAGGRKGVNDHVNLGLRLKF